MQVVDADGGISSEKTVILASTVAPTAQFVPVAPVNEGSQVTLREADVKVIEQLTSTILDEPESEALGM